jgi:uncharacterized protein (TIGR02270 family)
MTAVTSPRLFKIGLYEEHLEESSFLYDQCRALGASDGIGWTGLADFEERLEAHLDALDIGGDLALEVCRRRAVDGDYGELFAAVCLFCRRGDAALLAAVLRELDFSAGKRVTAVRDALRRELPEAWRESCVRGAAQGEGPRAAMLAEVIGYRRLPGADVLVDVIDRAGADVLPRVLWAIGRTRPASAAPRIRMLLQSPEPTVRRAAAEAAVRMGDAASIADIVSSLATGDRPELALALGLVGGRAVVPGLVELCRSERATTEVVTALGLLGDLAAVRPLVDALQSELLAPTAAQALYVITGATLGETVFVPDPANEDEMFDREIEAYRRDGTLPRRADGEPFGVSLKKLSTDAEQWTQWLAANGSRFRAGRRYRLGDLYHPDVLLRALRTHGYPKAWRGLAAEELLTRYNFDPGLEADMPVGQQFRILNDVAGPISRLVASFEAGYWYCGGDAV